MKPSRRIIWLLAVALVSFAGWFGWSCARDSRVAFLPADRRADWIVYPKPPDTIPHRTIFFTAVFRQSFPLDAIPANARLSISVFRQGNAFLNGQPLKELALDERDWKRRQAFDVAKYLRAGTNEISVTVSNSMGPPALWLALESGKPLLRSDAGWQVSLAGAEWQPAALASEPPAIRPGNFVFGRERMSDSLRRTWPALLVLALLGAGLVAMLPRPASKLQGRLPSLARLVSSPNGVLILIVLLWVILFCNNLPQMPAILGFDRDGHLQYIDYLLQKRALPLADEGWTMYQPPLFYLLSALAIGPFGVPASADGAVLALRAVSALTGILHLVLVFLCLRLLFPKRPGPQIVGLIIAGLLPANLCLSHHITNEVLAATFLTAALYFTLRLLTKASPDPSLPPSLSSSSSSPVPFPPKIERSRRRLHLAIGVCLGLSLLTKFSALLAIPVILAAVAWRDLFPAAADRGHPSAGAADHELPGASRFPAPSPAAIATAVRSVAIVSLATLAICGWHYFRVWRHFGNPLIGNWDPRLPFAWWQDPGYHTAGWYLRLGQAMVCPSFSSLYGLADGLYSSLWGDGLVSGGARMGFRPPWNYDLANAGYLLALVPFGLVLAGFLVMFVRFLRRPAAEGFLMLALIGGFVVGILLMTLRVPSYAQVKAFYALPALLPFCVLGALGWEFVARRGSGLRWAVSLGLVVWALTAFGSLWIRAANPFTHLVLGVGLAEDKRHAQALAQFQRALELDPRSLVARVQLTDSLTFNGRTNEAAGMAALALEQHPDAAEALMQMGLVVARAGRYEEGIGYFRRSIARAPDNPGIYNPLAICLARLGRHPEVIEACRQGLRVDPSSPDLRLRLASSLGRTGDFDGAVEQFGIAIHLNPKPPDAENLLAFALYTSGRLEEAAPHFQAALKQKPDDARLNYHYAMTLAALRRTSEAVAYYRATLNLQSEMVEALNNLAWLLSVSPDARLRDGPEAVRLAEHACDLTQRREPVLLGTLAAAYAETGRFSDAVATAETAKKLALDAGQKELADKNQELLELYRGHQPYRDPAAADR